MKITQLREHNTLFLNLAIKAQFILFNTIIIIKVTMLKIISEQILLLILLSVLVRALGRYAESQVQTSSSILTGKFNLGA